MDPDVTQLGADARVMAIKARGGTVRRRVDGIRIGSHLVATGAPLAMLRGVVVRRAIDESDRESSAKCDNQPRDFDETHHERNAVPFQLRTSEADAK